MSDYMASDPPLMRLAAELDGYVNDRAYAVLTPDEERAVARAALARDLIQLDEAISLSVEPHLRDYSLAHWPAARDLIETVKGLVAPTEGDL